MSRRAVTISIGPAAEPLTLSEAKSWLRIDGDDDDTLISQLIGTATAAAEQYLRRSLINQTLKLTIDLCNSGFDSILGDGVYNLPETLLYGALPHPIELPRGPIVSVTSITTYDISNTSSVYSSANYFVDTAGEKIVLNVGSIWPSNLRQAAACEVLYVAGYGATASSVPQGIKMAMLIHIASIYEQRGMCEDAMDLPPGAKNLLKQFRIMGNRLG
jgi:hypothetical protein